MEAIEGRRGGRPLLLLKVWKCEPGPPRALRQSNTLAMSWWYEERGPRPAQLEPRSSLVPSHELVQERVWFWADEADL